MGKRGEDQLTTKGSASAEVDMLKSKMEWMEAAVKNQAEEFRAELASAQAKMQVELKEQMGELIASVRRMQPQTPPPNTKPPESVASNMGQQNNLQSFLGENTPPLHPFQYLASPQSFVHSTKPAITYPTRPPPSIPQTIPPPSTQLGMPNIT
jgi:hypothetical protein